MYHERSKHINTHHHFIREDVKNKKVEVIPYKTNDQIVDIFTRSLKWETFIRLKFMLSMASLDWVQRGTNCCSKVNLESQG
jgi:hypothetical protein